MLPGTEGAAGARSRAPRVRRWGMRCGAGGGPFHAGRPDRARGGLNLYGYANGDPVNFSDPFGLCARSAGGDGRTLRWDDCPEGSEGYDYYQRSTNSAAYEFRVGQLSEVATPGSSDQGPGRSWLVTMSQLKGCPESAHGITFTPIGPRLDIMAWALSRSGGVAQKSWGLPRFFLSARYTGSVHSTMMPAGYPVQGRVLCAVGTGVMFERLP